MPGEVHQPGLGGLLLVTATGSTKVERSGADLIGTVAVDRTEDVLTLFTYTEKGSFPYSGKTVSAPHPKQ